MTKFEIINHKRVKDFQVTDLFWSKVQHIIIGEAIPYQEKILYDEMEGAKKSHAIANFKIAAGLEIGEFYGIVFQDSDVFKWLEGVAYALSIKVDARLEKKADEIIDIIEKAQQSDGYLNTYFTIKEPNRRWQNLQECHELYCAGHLMEAAVAYYQETGKDKLLKVASRFADHIANRFGVDKERGIPGHQEIEIGLMRLYRATGKEKYKKLSSYFIEERGKNPEYFIDECKKRDWSYFNMDPLDYEYSQCHVSVREQKKAVGHSVRAVYMYTAMADLAIEMNDNTLYEACKRLWKNMVNKQMYITGGIGSTAGGESFTCDYDLPNDSCYTETCASIGVVMFAKKMLDIEPRGEYADVIERELYNGILSGMQLDGKKFFYVNPLEVIRGVSGENTGFKHALPDRQKWYACACCPPNIVRLITSLATYAWSEKETIVYSHLFLGQQAQLKHAHITIESKMPWEGEVTYIVNPKMDKCFTLAIHIPRYAKNVQIQLGGEKVDLLDKIKDGYIYLERAWSEGDKVNILFDMKVVTLYSNPLVRANSGCVALQRGPVVYCFETADNSQPLQSYRIFTNTLIRKEMCASGPMKGMVFLNVEGRKLQIEENLYFENRPESINVMLKAIPYFAWGNRMQGDMRVWMQEAKKYK